MDKLKAFDDDMLYPYFLKVGVVVKEVLRRMKGEPSDKSLDQNCSTCEFNFGNVCAEHVIRLDDGQDIYGMPMEEADKMFANGCDDYEISLDAFNVTT